MNNYFTKYLPIDGEIRKGDKIIHKDHPEPMDVDALPSKPIAYSKNGWKAVKLFLCSRDIQVGDKVFEILSDKSIGDEFEWTEEIAKYNEPEPCFKIIGEISPEAVWVTEGMEFDEENLAIIYSPGEDMDNDIIPLKNWPFYVKSQRMISPSTKKMLLDNLCISVKCPTCQHFH